jgi:hypothetical protein
MAHLFSTGHRNAANDNGPSTIYDTNGRLAFFSGTDPTDPNAAIANTKLAEFTLATDAFGASASGVATLAAVSQVSGLAAGDITFAVFYRSGDTALTSAAGTSDRRWIMTDIRTTAGGDLQVNTLTVSVNLPISLTSFTLTYPASA